MRRSTTLAALAVVLVLSSSSAASAEVVSAAFTDFSPYAWLPITVDGVDVGYKPAGVTHVLVGGQPQVSFCLELDKPVLFDGTPFLAELSTPPAASPWCEMGWLLATHAPLDSTSASVLQLAVWKLAHAERLPPEVVASADAAVELAALELLAEAAGRCLMTCAPDTHVTVDLAAGGAGQVVGAVTVVQGGLPVQGQEVQVHVSGGVLLQPASGVGLTDGAGRLAVRVLPAGSGPVTVSAGTTGSDLRVLDPLDDGLQAMMSFFLGEPCSFGGSAWFHACTPTPDTDCDGVDDDCDGVADDDAPVTVTHCGTGGCANTGNRHCEGGQWIDTCHPGVPAGFDADCNGRDDDCDGLVDEAWVPVITTCGQGLCTAHGKLLCQAGVLVDTCVPGTTGGLELGCDGLDNDCDGTTDEGFIPVTTTCGVGECRRHGWLRCTSGHVIDDCQPGLPGLDTTCDGLDNDCDGATDEDASCGAECGDGVLQAGEGCDDGNLTAGDGCSPDCQVEGCVDGLGVVGGFNVFAFDTVCDLPDVGGGVAAGKLVTTNGFSFGHQHPGGVALVAGGDALLSNGTLNGDAWVAGTATFTGVGYNGGTLHAGPHLDFEAALAEAQAVCARVAALPATGTVTVDGLPWATLLVLEGSLPGVNVFELPATLLSAANSFTVRVPASATVIINVSGAAVAAHDFGFALEGAAATRMLWTACQATLVEAHSIGMQGTLLAPLADVMFDNGSWDGSIIAHTICGSGEPHWVPFGGEIPCE